MGSQKLKNQSLNCLNFIRATMAHATMDLSLCVWMFMCVLNAFSFAEHLQNVFGLRPKVCYKNIL